VTYTVCHIDTINSPDDGHMAARNMWRIEINIHEKEMCFMLVIYKDYTEMHGQQNMKIKSCLISNFMHKILIYLHIIRLLKSSTCFENYPALLQEVYVITVYIQPLVSSLSSGDSLLHWLRKSSLLTAAQDSHMQRVTIREAAYIQLRRRHPENARNM
jgi:hypothetical protein